MPDPSPDRPESSRPLRARPKSPGSSPGSSLPTLFGRRLPSWAVVLAAFGVLNGLVVLPDLLIGTLPVHPVDYLSWPPRFYYLFSLDVFVLVCLPVLLPIPAIRRHAWRITTATVPLLAAYEAYDAAIRDALQRDPVFLADAQHVVGAVHLLVNTVSPLEAVAGLCALAALLGGAVWGLPRLTRLLHRHAATPRVRFGLQVAVPVLVVILLGSALTGAGGHLRHPTYNARCFSTAGCVVRNALASATLQEALSKRFDADAPADSTYLGYDDLNWSAPPSIYVVMIESYGQLLATDTALAAPYNRLMRRTGDSLRAAGWHAATSTSRAPVVGGRSWLSIATTFLGTPVRHSVTLDVLRPSLPRRPHLVSVLNRQGYRTATLQAPVRPRPWLTVRNEYGFDRTFYLPDLDYTGPAFGWGIVPDAYSLQVAHDRFVTAGSAPFFLFFETTAPHYPWEGSPPPLDASTAAPWWTPSPRADSLPPSWTRRQTDRSRWRLSPARPASKKQRYFDLIAYDWRVLERYLRRQAPPHSLVVVLGDHAPKLGDPPGCFRTPIHVLSRDSSLVRRFHAHGFHSGLSPPHRAPYDRTPATVTGQRSPPADTSLSHAGVFSLLMHTVTAHDRPRRTTRSPQAAPERVLPPVRPRGVRTPALRPAPASTTSPANRP